MHVILLLKVILLLTFIERSVAPQTYEQVAWTIRTPQWVNQDAYTQRTSAIDRATIRYPNIEMFYHMTDINQELVILTDDTHDLFPKASEILKMNKSPRRFFATQDYVPLVLYGFKPKHVYAEFLDLRHRNFGSSNEVILPFLYLPTGWPLFVMVVFIITLLIIPLLGYFLVHFGFQVASIYQLLIWGPLKHLLRFICVYGEKSNRRWKKYLAPSYFLESRSTWKLPGFLRNDPLEDTPPELSYRPPTNKIDYTMYILTEEDYDELDLGMDELEFVDDMLEFRDEYPKVVARLLKYKLGIDKFYYYFDEDVLSDDEDLKEEAPANAEPDGKPVEDAAFQEDDDTLYLQVLDIDEPWMRDEFDVNYKGSNLEEIRKRRKILREMKAELVYLHDMIQKPSKYDEYMRNINPERRRRLQLQAKKLLERFLRYSSQTKEVVKELEPSIQAQQKHNPALSKYMPLINKMSHMNHRLNLKHEKKKDPRKRLKQLEVFGWP